MEISGKVLREVEFRDRLRGYDTDEVDEFLEQVALAVDELLAEHAALRQRAERVERQLQEAPELDDDGIRKTLVLAQRTADMALREARAEAEHLVAEARSRADSTIAEAEEEAARLRDEADRDVRQRSSHLTEQHERLTREIRILGALLESERARITQSLTEALRFVGESMGVSEDVTSALGQRAEPSAQRGEPGEAPAQGAPDRAASAESPRGEGPSGRSGEDGGARPAGRVASQPPIPPSPEGSRPGSGRRDDTPSAAGDPAGGRHYGAESTPPASSRPGVDSASTPANRDARPRDARSGDARSGDAAPGEAGGERSGYGGSPGIPRPSDQAGPGAALARSVTDLDSRRSRGGVEAAMPVVPRRPLGEREIEAELSEDASLAAGPSRRGTPMAAGPSSSAASPALFDEPGPRLDAARRDADARRGGEEPGDEDALWSRWAQANGSALDPLEPPPTQAYRLEPDGGWTA